MGKSIDWETREYAEDLYITRGYTLEQVASTTGVSLQQVKTWSTDDGWVERRTEYRQAMKDIRANTVRLRKELIFKALQSKDPQDVYAAAALERVAAMADRKDRSEAGTDAPSLEPRREIVTPADAIAALQDAVQAKINGMLARPAELSMAGIKDMRQALTLLTEMQRQYVPEEGTPAEKGLTEDAANEIRRKILGLKT